MKEKKIFPVLFLLACSLTVVFLFRETLITNYFQDDWYSISISKINNIFDFVNIFIPNKQVVYYRPLGMQLPFFFNTFFFGLNPFPFRIMTFVVHTLNSILVYYLFKRLLKSDTSSLLGGFLYSTSAVHYIPFFWSSTFAFILGMTFSLLTVIFFIDFLNEKQFKKLFLSLSAFILGFLTFEVTVVLPLILALYLYFYKFFHNFRFLFPFFFLSVSYFLFRSIFFPPPNIPDYQLALGKETLQNLKYYFLWSFNWPEEIKNQFIKFWQVNPKFIAEFFFFYISFLVTFLINLMLFIFLPVILIIRKKIRINSNLVIFSCFWFLSGLAPVIFFPKHAFPYYLPLSLLGLLLAFIYLFSKTVAFFSRKFNFLKYIFQIVLMISWLWSVLSLIEFNSLIHWAPRRGRLSANFIKTAKYKLGSPFQSFYFIVNPYPENRLALNDQDAFRLVFNKELFSHARVLPVS